MSNPRLPTLDKVIGNAYDACKKLTIPEIPDVHRERLAAIESRDFVLQLRNSSGGWDALAQFAKIREAIDDAKDFVSNIPRGTRSSFRLITRGHDEQIVACFDIQDGKVLGATDKS